MECKKINKLTGTLLCMGVLLISYLSCSSNKEKDMDQIGMQEINYSISFDLFPNPERGFYRHLSQPAGLLSESDLKGLLDTNISLVLRVYYLNDFRYEALPQELIDKLEADFNMIRNAGVKLLLRFAYSKNENDPDAPLSTIELHLEQLAPLLEKHKDIIALMQAGMIGAWGEWYYTSNKLNTPQARKTVLDKILQVLPEDRFVQVRTPAYKRQYTGINSPLKENHAFTSQAIARIGHHNDCFLASADDYGTYEDIIADKDFLGVEGLYVPMGGETCPPSGIDPADCKKVQAEMRKLRWSYLNQDYYRGVNDKWITEGCMDNIVREMGYRFVLRKGKISDKHIPGSGLFLYLEIENIGYTSPYNPRKAEIILASVDKTDIYKTSLGEDPRRWVPGTLQKIEKEISLPQEIKPGKYNLYLSLPDPEKALYDRPEYAVRLGNKDCWQKYTGYNDLKMGISIESDRTLPFSKSDLRFIKQ
ncbi:MAG: DUF4832 domain-containing protein [Tannerellaceae bacterium]|jgi:hypothetical protein|nr:DUF4832 domain-containing protein [Tannerellaceae bacterium]